MKPIISRKTVATYLRQTYALNEKQLFDNNLVNQQMRNEITENLLEEFTSTFYANGKLIARDPFTKKDFQLTPPDLNTINTTDDLMKLLSEAHKQRMQAITQYRIHSLEKGQEDKQKEQDIE